MAAVFTRRALQTLTGQAPEREGLCLHAEELEVTQPSIDELLGTVAHELRSPLATILSAVELIRGNCDMEQAARRALVVVERQSRQAMRIVDDLFDLSASSWGKLSLSKVVVRLADIVAGATETTQYMLTSRGHRLTVSLPPEPVTLKADPLRLEQVLTNLLSNAAKFTDPGGHIRLSAEVEAGQIVLRVRDNGRGIAPERLPQLFDLFQQIPGPGGQATSGLGIGLALVKSLVELHGGSVAASSDGPGTGAEFVVRLPTCASGS
jgi:signal transduction histidine kinase